MDGAAQLRPFDRQTALPLQLQASAQLSRYAANQVTLQLRYRLSATADLLLPAPLTAPIRGDGLWQHTCLEAFVGASAQEPYWEFNLAPNGAWNVYRLDGYRRGLQQESFYDALPFAVDRQPQQGPGVLEVVLACPLPAPLARAAELQVGLSAVLEDQRGGLSYWALAHPGPEADFHDRRGWLLRL
ncbi:MAG: DOMON-like domain-containing protein [Cyanobacteriota bacterium]|nr:DOMON-like domain-containing protein [Cyanobacteriota bacterium]